MHKFLPPSDTELYELAVIGNHEANRLLELKYRYFAHSFASNYLLERPWCGATYPEIVSCANLAYLTCRQSYNADVGRFFPYWRKCAEMSVISYFNSCPWLNGKEKSYLRIDSTDNNGALVANKIGEPDEGIEEGVFWDELSSRIYQHRDEFTKDEMAVIELLLKDYTADMIMRTNNFSRSKTYRLIRLVKEKIKLLLSK